jgi:ferredoxin-type protein NapH
VPKNLLVLRRRTIQWLLAPIVIVTIAFGWEYPILGFTVPVVMLMGMAGGLIRGRYVCGNLCPRGSFFDRLISIISLRRNIPSGFRAMPLRWIIFGLLMGFMVFRIAQNPSSWQHWGRVFWSMCVITTWIGIVLGILFHPRCWCALCPMGTMQNAFGGGRDPLMIDAGKCRMCRSCEKACPFGLEIVKDKAAGRLATRDCLKCPECIAALSRKSTQLQGRENHAKILTGPHLRKSIAKRFPRFWDRRKCLLGQID